MKRFPFILAACLVGAGCAHDDGVVASSLETSIQPSATTVPSAGQGPVAHATLASLPGQAVAGVRTTDYPDGLRQDVSFTHGPVHAIGNGMTIVARTAPHTMLEEGVLLFKPSEAAIRSEIGAQFPHVPMQVVARDSANAYGPYGLALGRAGGDIRCLYAWQYIDANRLPPDATTRGPMSLRIRLCQAGTTFDAMAAAIDHLYVGPDAASQVAAAAPEEQPGRILVATAEPPDPAKPRRRRALASRATPAARHEARRPVAARPVLAAAEPAAAPIGSDLPPEAYLGPTAGTRRATTLPHD